MKRRHEKIEKGIYVVHALACAGRIGDRNCSCKPTYQAAVWNKATQSVIKKHFPTKQLARSWGEDLRSASRAGHAIATPTSVTVTQALDEFMVGIESGSVLGRSCRPYKPSTIRSYKRAIERLKDAFGKVKITELRRRDIKAFAGRMRAEGFSASTISNTIDPLRAMYRKALDDELVVQDPTRRLGLIPKSHEAKVRGSVSPAMAERLIDALPESDRALWAMAIYVGLRRGELQELRWSDLDFDAGVGRCQRAWDDEGAEVVMTKSRAGNRTFPLPDLVLKRLRPHKLRTGRGGKELVFGTTASDRFTPSTVRRRSRAAWKAARLEPITLHEGRHSAATSGARAGLDDLMLSGIMGHSSAGFTKDVYGHVRDDHMSALKQQIDSYLEAAINE